MLKNLYILYKNVYDDCDTIEYCDVRYTSYKSHMSEVKRIESLGSKVETWFCVSVNGKVYNILKLN